MHDEIFRLSVNDIDEGIIGRNPNSKSEFAKNRLTNQNINVIGVVYNFSKDWMVANGVVMLNSSTDSFYPFRNLEQRFVSTFALLKMQTFA